MVKLIPYNNTEKIMRIRRPSKRVRLGKKQEEQEETASRTKLLKYGSLISI